MIYILCYPNVNNNTQRLETILNLFNIIMNRIKMLFDYIY